MKNWRPALRNPVRRLALNGSIYFRPFYAQWLTQFFLQKMLLTALKNDLMLEKFTFGYTGCSLSPAGISHGLKSAKKFKP
jgi:hypothetical protein